jgi:hypothetical protein
MCMFVNSKSKQVLVNISKYTKEAMKKCIYVICFAISDVFDVNGQIHCL